MIRRTAKKMILKKGTKVRIRKYLGLGKKYGGIPVNFLMFTFLGQIVTIYSYDFKSKTYCIEEDNHTWLWHISMFEQDCQKTLE